MSQMGRRILAAALALLALPFLFVAAVGSEEQVNYSVRKSRVIAHQFAAAAEQIEAFRIRYGQLPTSEEFARLFAARQGRLFKVEMVSPGDVPCDGQQAEFEALPADAYVLITFRGEWYECAAPQHGLTTLLLDHRSYYVTGTNTGDRLFWLVTVIGLLVAAFVLWRRRPEAAR